MDPKYVVGIPDIDDQHEQIYRLIEALHEAASRDSRKHLFRPALKRLQQLLSTHFVCEEALMGMVGFAGLPQHRRLHAELLKIFGDYLENAPVPERYDEVERSIAEKVLGHVMSHDMQMIGMIKEYLQGLKGGSANGNAA